MLLRSALAALALALASPAGAADVRLVNDNRDVAPEHSALAIWMSGDIVDGDRDRLALRLEEAARVGRPLWAIYLDSPGGSLREGVRLGQLIRSRGLRTVVRSNAMCASSCILAWAGGTDRVAFRGAAIGVHSAAVQGVETSDAQAGTLAMARQASELGLPDSVIVHLINTRPAAMHWLSGPEIRAIAGTGAIDKFRFGTGPQVPASNW